MTSETFNRLMAYLDWSTRIPVNVALRLVAVDGMTQTAAALVVGVPQGLVATRLAHLRRHVAKLEALTGIDFELTIKDGRKK